MVDYTADGNTGGAGEVSRRGFLRRTACCGAAAWLGGRVGFPRAGAARAAAPSARPEVCEVVMREAIVGRRVHPTLVHEMLNRALCLATGADTTGQAWRRLVDDDDIILAKFNQSGADTLRTGEALARAVVSSLRQADISPERVMLLEVPPHLAEELKTRCPPQGWADKEYDFARGSDQFLAALDEASAIINVPFLKTHNLAGMTGCLKNLSHGLIKHPARYHGNGCSPYIGDIVACEAIGPKLRFNILNGLRVMVDRGPQASEDHVDPACLLILSADPVAADACGLIWLNRLRKGRNLSPLGGSGESLPYLQEAQDRGVGSADIDEVNRELITL